VRGERATAEEIRGFCQGDRPSLRQTCRKPRAPGQSDLIRTERRCTLTTLSRAGSDEFPVLLATPVFKIEPRSPGGSSMTLSSRANRRAGHHGWVWMILLPDDVMSVGMVGTRSFFPTRTEDVDSFSGFLTSFPVAIGGLLGRH
jgi:hypothetical protein